MALEYLWDPVEKRLDLGGGEDGGTALLQGALVVLRKLKVNKYFMGWIVKFEAPRVSLNTQRKFIPNMN